MSLLIQARGNERYKIQIQQKCTLLYQKVEALGSAGKKIPGLKNNNNKAKKKLLFLSFRQGKKKKNNLFWCSELSSFPLTSEGKTKITRHWLDHALKSVPRTVKLFKLSASEKYAIIYKNHHN